MKTSGPYLVHHFHFPCPWVFAAPIFSMLVVYWVWHKLFYNVAHFPFPFCLHLFPRGTFPHRGGVQFRFTGLKQPYIFALLIENPPYLSAPVAHRTPSTSGTHLLRWFPCAINRPVSHAVCVPLASYRTHADRDFCTSATG